MNFLIFKNFSRIFFLFFMILFVLKIRKNIFFTPADVTADMGANENGLSCGGLCTRLVAHVEPRVIVYLSPINFLFIVEKTKTG